MKKIIAISFLLLSLSACGTLDKLGLSGAKNDDPNIKPVTHDNAPLNTEYRLQRKRGKLTGEDGFNLLGGGSDESGNGGGSLGVNSFLWRATLDTLAFMPFASADPFGGVILTDWYEDPKTPGERFKVNAIIMDTGLRADAIKVKLFKQKMQKDNQWRDVEVHPTLARKLEDTILTRAREIRVNHLARKGD
jgi:hypothetical protein